MRRRHILFSISSGFTIFAGCTSDNTTEDVPNDDTTEDAPSNDTTGNSSDEAEVPYEEFPDAERLLEEHSSALSDISFEATEYIEQNSPTQDPQVTEKTIRGGNAGTLLRGNDVAGNASSQGPGEVWFTDNAEISRATHSYYPNGVVPRIIDRDGVEEIIAVVEFKQGKATDEEEPAVVFEATSPSEAGQEADLDFQLIDVTVEVAAAGYIRLMKAEIDFAQSADADETTTLIYEYQVTDVGEVSVTPPEFVDDALRVEAGLTDDGSAVVLKHAGGPTVEADTPLTFKDTENVASAGRNESGVVYGPTFPEEFAEGDTAYVYWIGAEEATLSMGEKPSNVARKIALPSEDGNDYVYLRDEAGPGPKRFEVRFRSEG